MANAAILAFCLLVCCSIVAESAHAQPFAPPTVEYRLDLGDPYQIVAPPEDNLIPSGILPTGGLFGGGRLFKGRIFGRSDPYNAKPTASQLNSPMVGIPSSEAMPVIGSPIVQGGAVYNSTRSWLPLFPRCRSRVKSRLYLRGEYLVWSVSGMNTPPLVTTSPNGTPVEMAAVLGQPGTSVLFGGAELNDSTIGGILLSSGWWLSPERTAAIESEYIQLASGDDSYYGASDGSVILGRPFFDIVEGRQTARLVSYPDFVSGEVRASTKSEMKSFLLNARMAICPTHGVCCQQCDRQERTDWILGYRNIRLRDSLAVHENLISEIPTVPGTIAVSDEFQATNQFNGLQLGIIHRSLIRKRGWLESSLRVALGNNEQSLRVAGSTTYNESGVVDTLSGGLLAQRTNSGTFKRDEFVMVPEVAMRLGIQVSERFHTSIGYSVLYFPNVIRAGEQIDTDINPGLIPDEDDPLTGPLRPRVLWLQSDYLAHGLHFSGEFHF